MSFFFKMKGTGVGRVIQSALGFVLLLSLAGGSAFTIAPPRAEAVGFGVLVSDIQNNIKEQIADGIGFILINAVIDMLGDAMIGWIQKGFQGGPAFVTNPEEFFLDVANQSFARFFAGNGLDALLCSNTPFPFFYGVFEHRYKGRVSERFRCTLSAAVENLINYDAMFRTGRGWESWLELTTQPQNNYQGQYVNGLIAMDERLAHDIGLKKNYLDWGRGFLSSEKCTDRAEEDLNDDDKIDDGDCRRWETKTPGSIVEGQLNSSLDSGRNRLEIADEINEIIGALASTLLKMATQGLTGNLKTGSQPRGSDGTTYLLSSGEIDFAKLNKAVSSRSSGGTVEEGAPPLEGGVSAPQEFYNVAPGGRAEQSTTRFWGGKTWVADAAIDGRDDQQADQYNIIAITELPTTLNPDIKGWWEVKLPYNALINEIRIFRAAHQTVTDREHYSAISLAAALGATAGEVGVYLLNETHGNKTRVNIPAANFTSASHPIIIRNINKEARYVRIERLTPGALWLAEVEVYGAATTTPEE